MPLLRLVLPCPSSKSKLFPLRRLVLLRLRLLRRVLVLRLGLFPRNRDSRM